MRSLVAAIVMALCVGPAAALDQEPSPLDIVAPLAGEWQGAGEGQPGMSTATRQAAFAHDGRFLIVQGKSVYAPQPGNERGETHTSTDIWSFDKARGVLVLRQFDSLGFVCTYVQDRAVSTPGHIVLVGESFENVPPGLKARYTYDIAGDSYREHFELDFDGQGLKSYVLNQFERAQR